MKRGSFKTMLSSLKASSVALKIGARLKLDKNIGESTNVKKR